MKRGRGWVAATVTLAACSEGDARGKAWFVEDSARSGLEFVHVAHAEQRHWFPEIMGSGVALFDYDGDGWLDVYCVQSGDLALEDDLHAGNRLFKNRGDGSFEDVTARAGVGGTLYGMGAACGDYDGDGDLDLYVTGVGHNTLYQNQGDGTFRDVTGAAGCADHGWSTSAAFVDYDRDGALDLIVAHYVVWSPEMERDCRTPSGLRDYCHPNSYKAAEPDTLFHNRGDGTFEDVSERAGVSAGSGNSLGIACGDFDGDGWPDLYVANDMNPSHLWINRRDGTLRDEALLRGCALAGGGFPEAGMGVQACDVDQDGDLDLFKTHLRNQKNTLYLNDGRGNFDDVSATWGLAAPSLPYTGFGLGFHDFDHDGLLDLFVANGRVVIEDPSPDPNDLYAEENQLMRGVRPGRFEEVLPRGGTEPVLLESGRGAAFGDLDNDGDIDVVVANRAARLHLLRNRVGKPGAWVMFDVRDERGGIAAGARVEIEAGGARQFRFVDPGYSYLSSNDPRVHFGIGTAKAIERVRVRWPDGKEQDFGALAVGRLHTLRRAGAR